MCQRTEDEIMLDILHASSLEIEQGAEVGADVRAIWDAAGKPCKMESTLHWDVVATPAMMMQFAVTVANGPASVPVR